MYVGKYIILLSKWDEEYRNLVTNLLAAFGVMMVPIGFLMMTDEDISKFWIYLIGGIGFISLFVAVSRAEREDRKRWRESKYLFTLLEAIARKLGVDVDNIKKGK